jgi:hypothetical protein
VRSRVTIAAALAQTSVVVVIAALAVGCGSRQAATKTPARFTARAVKQAFASVGLELRDPAPSGSSPHLFATVTMLTSLRPHLGWTIAAYIYPTPNQANASFAEDAGEWGASGIASVQVKNIVVVVIPNGHLLTQRARFFPMPKLVFKALHILTHTQ